MVARRAQVMPILVIGLGALLLTGTVLMSPWLRGKEPTSAPTSEPSDSTVSAPERHRPTGSVDGATRRVVIDAATMMLPADPYAIGEDPVSIDGVVDVCFLAEAVVHRRSGTTPGWAAMVGLAHLDPAISPSEPDALRTITQHFFGSYPTTLTDVRSTTVEISGHPAVRLTATVHYAVKGLPSTYDDVTAIVVPLGEDSTVIAMTSIPDDAPAEVRAAALASLKTLTVR